MLGRGGGSFECLITLPHPAAALSGIIDVWGNDLLLGSVLEESVTHQFSVRIIRLEGQINIVCT